MEKNSWKQVRHNNRNSHVPNARWGHSCCVIEDEVIYFGGYADSTYMNDLWSFNSITMEWKEVETLGEIPSARSNCSINYDQANNKIIIFGGGGPNKVRYNTISILDWKTKLWTEITPKLNQPAPWERTYHTAELFSHYLITFGGEGLGDLDDLWIFDFETQRWTEVPISKTSARPSARRFHSSAIVNNQFFVIAGCYAKYRCLSDIYSINLAPFLQTGKASSLSWRQRKMKEYTFLTRWGHTSAVYENKICVFGGRFCNDLNDFLIIDPSKDLISTLKVSGEIPKARRRHSACFLGNSMLVFGGFNGEYYNDLHYISIKFPKKKLCIQQNITQESLEALNGLKSVQWQFVETKDGSKQSVCVGLLIQRFSSLQHFDNFLKEIEGKYTDADLREIIMTLYRGHGKIDLGLTYQFGISIYETKEEFDNAFRKSISLNESQVLSVVKRAKQLEPVILLDEQSYAAYLQQKRMEECYFDTTLNINDDAYFRANKALLVLNSQYFFNLFSKWSEENADIIKMPFEDVAIFQTLLNYLSSNFVVASSHATHAFWIGLLEMAEYLSLEKLAKICENELLSYVSEYSSQELLMFSLKMDLSVLANSCCELIIKRMVNFNREQNDELLEEKQNECWYNKKQMMLKRVYNMNRFDLLQKKIDIADNQQRESLKKKQSSKREKHQQEKQNNQIKN